MTRISAAGQMMAGATPLAGALRSLQVGVQSAATRPPDGGVLGADGPEVEPRLVEMSWGEWEGATLRRCARHTVSPCRKTRRAGSISDPCGGESPREVRERLRDVAARACGGGEPLVAVTHKGVIRCALSAGNRLAHAGQAARPSGVGPRAFVQCDRRPTAALPSWSPTSSS